MVNGKDETFIFLLPILIIAQTPCLDAVANATGSLENIFPNAKKMDHTLLTMLVKYRLLLVC